MNDIDLELDNLNDVWAAILDNYPEIQARVAKLKEGQL
jgi:hypothetical protein